MKLFLFSGCLSETGKRRRRTLAIMTNATIFEDEEFNFQEYAKTTIKEIPLLSESQTFDIYTVTVNEQHEIFHIKVFITNSPEKHLEITAKFDVKSKEFNINEITRAKKCKYHELKNITMDEDEFDAFISTVRRIADSPRSFQRSRFTRDGF